MISNKKATMEWPTFLISTVFSMLLFIIGVFMIIDVAKTSNFEFQFHTEQLNYGLLASRVLNSADCLAWEEKTPNGYLVRAGILDFGKFSADRIDSCISGKSYYVEFVPLSKTDSFSPTIKGISRDTQTGILYLAGTNTQLDKKYYDWFAAKLFSGGRI